MTVLVTGGAGYIGSHTVRLLRELGREVVVYDSLELGHPSRVLDAPLVVGDVHDQAHLQRVIEQYGVDSVIHFAAYKAAGESMENPGKYFDNIVGGSLSLLEATRATGVSRFVFASSCSMYGASGTDDLIEEDAPLRPLTAYAESKVRAEEALHELADDDFAPVFMRNATAYGASPRFRFDVVLNNLSAWAFTTGRVLIMSDGTPWRPLVHVRDIVKAAASALVAPHALVADQAFNVGANKENYRVSELAEIVRDTFPACKIEYAEGAGPDPRSYRVDFAKLGRTLPEAKPVWTARDGVLELFDAFRTVGFTMDSFDSYTRLARLKALLDEGALDGRLRWQHAAELA